MKVIFIIVILAAIAVPFSFTLNFGSTIGIVFMDGSDGLLIMPQRIFAGMNSFALLAIPLFILTGEIMNRARISDGLIQLAGAIVGHLKGGLAQVNILASIFFAGITGSAVSDTAAIGSILIPAMEKEGYDLDFSTAVTAASSVIGPIIPPSVTFIFYSSYMVNYPEASVSVAALFAAGIFPGLLVGFSLMVITYFLSHHRNYPKLERWVGFSELCRAFLKGIPGLLVPLIILAGIVGGVFTPTEAAGIAVALGLVIGFFLTKALKIKDLYKIFAISALRSSIILFIIGAGNLLSYLLQRRHTAEHVAEIFLGITSNYYILLILVIILLLLAGMFIDIAPCMILLGPILAPIMIKQGMHPLHFGLFLTTTLIIGLATPPFGLILFAACGLTGLKFEQLAKAIWPFLLAEIIVVILIAFIPGISMIIPRWLGLGGVSSAYG